MKRRIAVELLGQFRVSGDGLPVEAGIWRRGTARRLLALIALAPNHRVRREVVVDTLWPASGVSAATNHLHQVLHGVRGVIDTVAAGDRRVTGSVLRLEAGSLFFDDTVEVWVDVTAFEAAAVTAVGSERVEMIEAALALYGGDLLPDDLDAAWTVARRESLRQTMVDLRVRLARVVGERGEAGRAIQMARQVIEGDPTREDAHRLLVHLYEGTGQHDRAARQVDQWQEVLAREGDAVAGDVLVGARSAGEGVATGSMVLGGVLPRQVTRFVGRESALVAVDGLVERSRCLTITGAGGSGKTRLAIEWAERRRALFPGGCGFVDLTSTIDAGAVTRNVARALRLTVRGGEPLPALIEAFQGERALLILDNCEHLIAACAELVMTLLDRCPRLQIVATSRQSLGMSEEIAWRLPPIGSPELDLNDPDELVRFPAVQLFVDRARFADPSFRLTAENASAVARICARLGDLPLAIELAAARTRMLPVAAIAAGLERGIDGIAGTNGRQAVRHRSLGATLDWSYELLDRRERLVFRRLAVFVGGFTSEAAGEVCGDAGRANEVESVLGRLVDKSLLIVGEGETDVRYWMLEPIRQYAESRLRRDEEREVVRRRHAEHYARLAEEAEGYLAGSEQAGWLDRLERDHDNVRVALRWATAGGDGERVAIGLRLAGAIWRFWQLRNHHREGRRWLKLLLEEEKRVGVSEAVVATALNAAGNLARDQADFVRATTAFRESLRLRRAIGDDQGAARALNNLSLVARETGELEAALALGDESARLAQAVGDRFGAGLALLNVGQAARWQGDFAVAERYFAASLAAFWELDDRWHRASILALRARMLMQRGEMGLARVDAEESLALQQRVGDRWGIAVARRVLGRLALVRGDEREAAGAFAEALRLLRELDARRTIPDGLVDVALIPSISARLRARLVGAAEREREALGYVPPADERLATEQAIDDLLARLGEEEWTVAEAAGRAMELDEAIGLALSGVDAVVVATLEERGGVIGRLTEREREVAGLVASGVTNRGIAARLEISERTVETYVSRLLTKLGVASRTRVGAVLAEAEGVVGPDGSGRERCARVARG